jgi:hypothetical protein
MYIRCPHCGKIHGHGFNGDYHFKHRRVPHCESFESHTISFPSDGLYENERRRGLYVRAGADPVAYFAQFDPAPKVDVSDRRKWTEALEEVELDGIDLEPICVDRLNLTVTGMITGELETARSYLEMSYEKGVFSMACRISFIVIPQLMKAAPVRTYILKDDPDGNHKTTRTEIERTITSGETALHIAACE